MQGITPPAPSPPHLLEPAGRLQRLLGLGQGAGQIDRGGGEGDPLPGDAGLHPLQPRPLGDQPLEHGSQLHHRRNPPGGEIAEHGFDRVIGIERHPPPLARRLESLGQRVRGVALLHPQGERGEVVDRAQVRGARRIAGQRLSRFQIGRAEDRHRLARRRHRRAPGHHVVVSPQSGEDAVEIRAGPARQPPAEAEVRRQRPGQVDVEPGRGFPRQFEGRLWEGDAHGQDAGGARRQAHSQAAPRTPELSPWRFFTSRVSNRGPKTWAAIFSGTVS